MAVASGAAVIHQSFPVDASIVDSGSTITRVRGIISVALDSAAADIDVTGAIGFGIFGDSAFAAGVASLLTPYDEANWGGWFVHQYYTMRYELLDATGSLFSSIEFEIDSKAQRKLELQNTMVVVAESNSGAVDISIQFRMLVLLP